MYGYALEYKSLEDGKFLKGYNAKTVSLLDSLVENSTAGSSTKNKLINKNIEDGTKVGIRLNLSSKIDGAPKGVDKLQTLHKNNFNGKALSYVPYATVENVIFNVSQKGRAGIASKKYAPDVPEAQNKFPAMSVDGNYKPNRNILNELDNTVVEIGFNPMNLHLFVDMKTGQAVKGADVATVIGDRVYAKNVTYLKKADAPDPIKASDKTELPSEVRYKFADGGLLPSSLTPKRSTMAMNPILKHHYENIATGKAVENEDGSLSTVKTAIVEIDGKETLIPTVWNGEILEGNRLKEAIDNAVNSGVKWPSIDAENVKAIERLNNLDKLLHQDMEPISKEEAQKVLVKEFSKRRNIDNGIQRLYDTTKTEDEINFNTFKNEPEIQERGFGQGLKNKIPKWLKGFDPLGDKKSLTVGFDFNKGGTPMMEKQMEMFEDGGLKDQGGTVDPISGNDVPIGSTKKEVRDDIPAQLSEGEFVFPADVVRYIGLEKLMNLRQQAKMGLKRMEQMGQMGNSDEATIPDDMPFGMADLIVVSPEGKEVEMAEGGVVQAATGVDVQPTTRPLVTSAMNTGTRPNVPTFQDVLGQASIKLKQYQNKEGATLMVPHMGEIPIYEVPAGYFEVNADGTPVRPEDVPTGDIEKPAETQVVPRPDQEYGGDLDVIGMVPGSVGSAASSIAATSSMADLMTGKREPSMLEKMYIGSKPQIAMTNRQLSAAGVQITGNPKQDLLALTLYNSINEGKRSGIIPNSEEDIKNKKDIIDLKTMYVPESTRIANQQMTKSKPITQDEIAKSQTEQAMVNREKAFGDIPSVSSVPETIPAFELGGRGTPPVPETISVVPSAGKYDYTIPNVTPTKSETESVADKINLLTSEGVQAIDQPTFNELVSNVEPGYVPFQIGEKTFERPSMGFDATTDFGPPKGEPAKAAELYEKVLESPLNRRARRDLKSLGLEAKEEARAKTAEEFAQAEAKRAEDEQIAAQKQLEQLMAEDASKEASTANDGTSDAATSGAGAAGAIDPDASPGIMNKGGLAAKKPKKKATRKMKKGGLAASKK